MQPNRLKRREFITLAGGAVAAWPLAVRAQQGQMPIVGYLGVGSADATPHLIPAFLQGLQSTGFIPDRNVSVTYRWADGDYGRLPALAAELVQHRVNVIVTFAGFPTANAAKAATTTIPIVFIIGGDPVTGGLVSSLNHPGSNLTGITAIATEIGSKRLEALHQLTPKADLVAVLVNRNNRTSAASTADSILRSAAAALGLQLIYLTASTLSEIDAAFVEIARHGGVGALYIAPDPFFITQAGRLAELSNRYAVPASTEMREFPFSGGLMSYGVDTREMQRVAGTFAGKILKGDNPADLPVQRATKLELVINLKTAKALGLTVPLTLQTVADELIE
jgi:putative ABC transport system substrate-binding protein